MLVASRYLATKARALHTPETIGDTLARVTSLRRRICALWGLTLGVGCAARALPPAAATAAHGAPQQIANPTREVELAWRLRSVELADDEEPRLQIELLAELGKVQARLVLEAKGWGMLFVAAQQCRDDWAASSLSELWLSGGGNRTYRVRWRDVQHLEVSQVVTSDGACTDAADAPVACPEQITIAGTLTFPSSRGAAFRSRFIVENPSAPPESSPPVACHAPETSLSR